MDFTDDELKFLAQQGFSPDNVFDARGWPSRTWKRMAKEQGKVLVLGARCQKAHHRIRTLAGHCAQCDTSKLAYATRHSKTGYVYIAGSLMNCLIKVGGTEHISDREETLRDQAYGGSYDWRIIRHVWVLNFGKIEYATQRILTPYSAQRSYFKDGRQQRASEVFQCSFVVASNALDTALRGSPSTYGANWVSPDCRSYEFT